MQYSQIKYDREPDEVSSQLLAKHYHLILISAENGSAYALREIVIFFSESNHLDNVLTFHYFLKAAI